LGLKNVPPGPSRGNHAKTIKGKKDWSEKREKGPKRRGGVDVGFPESAVF